MKKTLRHHVNSSVIAFAMLAVSNLAHAFALNLGFVENKGQLPPQFQYSFQSKRPVLITQKGTLQYAPTQDSLTETFNVKKPIRFSPTGTDTVLISRFQGNNERISTTGTHALLAKNAWPGISIRLNTNGDGVEKQFTVDKNANPKSIEIKANSSLSINKNGTLATNKNGNAYEFSAPKAWQLNSQGKTETIDIAYELRGKENYGFKLGKYDSTKTLWIDPIVKSTSVATDADLTIQSIESNPKTGDIYILGSTAASGIGIFPSKTNLSQIFIARLDSTLSQLLNVTFYSLTSKFDNTAKRLKINPENDDVYVLAKEINGYFITLDKSLNHIKNTTPQDFGYIECNDLLIDNAHSKIYIVGSIGKDQATSVTNLGFIPSSALQNSYAGTSADGLNHDGIILAYPKTLDNDIATTFDTPQGTFLGGDNFDTIFEITYSKSTDSLYIIGNTNSTKLAGVSTNHADKQTEISFVAKISPDLSQLEVMKTSNVGGSYFHHLTANSAALYLQGSPPSGAGAFLSRYDLALNLDKTVPLVLNVSNPASPNNTSLKINPETNRVIFAGIGNASTFSVGTTEHLCGNLGCKGRDVYIARYTNDLSQLEHEIQYGGESDEDYLSLTFAKDNSLLLATETNSTALPNVTTNYGAASALIRSLVIAKLNGISTVTRTKPNAFSFAPITNAKPGSTQQAEIVLDGFDSTLPLRVSSGEYSLTGCGGEFFAFDRTPVDVRAETMLCIKQTASNEFNTQASSNIVIGEGENEMSAQFSITTEKADTSPDPFSLVPQVSRVLERTEVTSNQVTITGINSPTLVHIENGTFSIGCGDGNYTANDSYISNNTLLCARQMAGSAGSSNVTTVSVGDFSASLQTTTDSTYASGKSGGGGGSLSTDILILAFLLAYLRKSARQHDEGKLLACVMIKV